MDTESTSSMDLSNNPAKRIKGLSADQRKLARLLIREKGIVHSPEQQSIPIRNHKEKIPLSLAQEGLWFIDQLEPGNANFSMPGTLRLRGNLHIEILKKSLNEIVRRHEILRTTFGADKDGIPYQIVHPSKTDQISFRDLTHLDPSKAEEEALLLATKEAQKPFDLQKGPLFRQTLIRIGHEDHVLLLNFHHIICDGWSMGVFTRELLDLYSAFFKGENSPFSKLPIQFSDYAAWQREQLQGKFLSQSASFWKQHLGNSPPNSNLPTDRKRPAMQTFNGSHLPIEISEPLTLELKTLIEREGVTKFVFLQAVFRTLLYLYSNLNVIIVGSTFANRGQPETVDMIGYFANTLPLRTDIFEDTSFRELFQMLQDVLLRASAYQELPPSQILRELKAPRDASRNPLYQVVFDLLTPDVNPAIYGYGMHSTARETMELPGLKITPMDVEGEVARFDIAVFLWDFGHRLTGVFEYNTDLFDSNRIEQMIADYGNILNQVIANPEIKISDLAQGLKMKGKETHNSSQSVYVKESARNTLKKAKRKPIKFDN